MNEKRAVRRYLLELSPNEAPLISGLLLADSRFGIVDEMINVANDLEQWKAT